MKTAVKDKRTILSKIFLIQMTIFFVCSYSCILAQDTDTQTVSEIPPVSFVKELSPGEHSVVIDKTNLLKFPKNENIKVLQSQGIETKKDDNTNTRSYRLNFLKSESGKSVDENDEPLKFPLQMEEPTENLPPPLIDDSGKSEHKEKFHWKPALIESFYFLGIQHSFRMLQKKTRNELDGPFFRDWGKSVKNLGGWRDGDSFITNYIAHPMQGAVTGRIFINNSGRSRKLEFGKSKEYWESRLKAMVWSTVWSTQFELGPISEASIGNVGLYDNVGPNRMGWVDLVVTPTAGTGVLIGEDMIDKFILKRLVEKRIKSRTRIKIYRTFLTPIQSFTNVLGGKVPWKRYDR